MTDTEFKIGQATAESRISELERSQKATDERLEQLSHDAVSKKAISWILGTLAAVLVAAQTLWHMLGEVN